MIELNYHILTAMICITIIGSIYLLMGHNSVGFALLVSTISALAGYLIPSPAQKKLF